MLVLNRFLGCQRSSGGFFCFFDSRARNFHDLTFLSSENLCFMSGNNFLQCYLHWFYCINKSKMLGILCIEWNFLGCMFFGKSGRHFN